MKPYDPEAYCSRVGGEIKKRGENYLAGDDNPLLGYKRQKFLREFLDSLDFRDRTVLELSDDVFVPPSAACCGFAGDRGFLHPELTEAATQEEAAEVRDRAFDAHVSTNRTCEIGMERATGRPYVHVVQLLELLSREA